ncbi:MAG: D-alanyl-D-alanine carboxypeptidase/D-alanyl-D-alanine-endopeptidase [Bacteroidia bacterium]|nr:D-alanyl-D-alanine carboxypeptidase/D-alanyl-D-alanine-endopeptidase [Bacteroidia bacterium]
MRFLSLILFLCWGVVGMAQQPVTSVPETAQSAVIMDLETGEIVASCNPYMMLTPASLTKMITTAAGLEYLGRNFRFKTRFRFSANKDGEGRIVVIADGDPTIDSKYFRECTIDNIVDTLLASLGGVARYRLELEDDYFRGAPYVSKRLWEDMGNYYGAAYGTYNIGDNTQVVHLSSSDKDVWQSTYSNKKTAKDRIDEEEMTIYAKAYEGKTDSAYIYGVERGNRYISGAIPANRREFEVKAAMTDARCEYVKRFSEAMERRGKRVVGYEYIEGKREGVGTKQILEYSSPKLIDIIKETNQKSINLFADAICFALGRAKIGGGERTGSSSWDDAMMQLRRYARETMRTKTEAKLYDGAGLSPMNAVSVYQIASMLRYISQQPYYEDYRGSLAQAGKSGTLASFGKGTKLQGKVIGKSGSMTGVMGYAGYISHKYSFCIIFNHDPRDRKEQRSDMAEWLMRWGL